MTHTTPNPMSGPVPSAAAAVPPVPRRPLLVRLVQAVDPIRMFFGPVFQRDMRVLGRKKGTYWARGLYTLAIFTFVALMFSAMASDNRRLVGAAQVQRFQELAPIMAVAIGWFQLIAAMFIGPVLTAPAICDEKRNRTATALATSPLTAGQIICSSLVSRVVQMVILLLASAPLLLALRVFGGLEAGMVLGISAITVTAGILGAALGLWGSVHAKRPASGAAFGLFWMAVLCLMPLIVAMINVAIMGPRSGPANMVGMEAAVAVSPAFSLVITTFPGGFPLPVPIGVIWLINSAVNLALAGVVCVIASLQLRRVLKREAAETPATVQRPTKGGETGAADAVAGGERSAGGAPRGLLAVLRASVVARIVILLFGLLAPGWFFFDQTFRFDESPAWPMIISAEAVVLSIAFLFPARRRARIVSDAPVLWREVRQNAFGGPILNLVVAMGAAAVISFAYSQGGAHDGQFALVLVVICSLVALLQTCSAAGGAIAGEVQSRTWHVLLTTPLSADDIIRGKIVGVVRRSWPLGAIMLFHFAVMCLRGELRVIGVFLVAMAILSGVVFLASLGVALSLYFRKNTPATVWTVITGVGLWAVAPGVFGMIMAVIGFFRVNGPAEAGLTALFAISPLPMAGIALTGSLRERYGWGGLRYDTPSGHLDLGSFMLLELVGCGVLWLFAYLAYLWAVKAFTRLNAKMP